MRDYKGLSRNAYNSKAKKYENLWEGKYTLCFKEELLKTMEIKPGHKILDVACGTGYLLGSVKAKYEGVELYGVDISDGMIEYAKEHNPGIHFTRSDGEELPFKKDTFDVITVSAAFHHFPNPIAFLIEAKRVLKPGGKIHIAELYMDAIPRFVLNMLFYTPFIDTGDVKLYSIKEMEIMYAEAGLTGIGVQKIEVEMKDIKIKDKFIQIATGQK